MAIETLQPFLTFYRQYKPDAQVSEGKLFEQTFWQTADVLNLIRYREEKKWFERYKIPYCQERDFYDNLDIFQAKLVVAFVKAGKGEEAAQSYYQAFTYWLLDRMHT